MSICNIIHDNNISYISWNNYNVERLINMNNLNKFFILTMIIGIILISVAIKSENPLLVGLTGYSVCTLSAVGYALNGGK